MTVKLDILTVYANHLLLHFGNDAMAMFYKLPDFEVEAFGNGFLVTADVEDEGDIVLLAKALEQYAIQEGKTVLFYGHRFEPSAMLRVA